MKKLNENYHGEIYHYTSLIQALWIIESNCLYSNISSSDQCTNIYRNDARKYVNKETPFISFTRDKNYNIQGNSGTIVRFVFDGDVIQNIRNARLYPYAFANKRGESEERVFGVDIYPLNKFVKRIDIKISDEEYSWTSDRDFDEENELYDEFSEKYPDLSELELSHKISDYILNKIMNNTFFKNKIKVTGNLTEDKINKIVNETIKKYIL